MPQEHTFFYLVEAAGLEPTVSSTRNWRDTTFATPRNENVRFLQQVKHVVTLVTCLQICNTYILAQFLGFVN